MSNNVCSNCGRYYEATLGCYCLKRENPFKYQELDIQLLLRMNETLDKILEKLDKREDK